jgi:hypothetical protein
MPIGGKSKKECEMKLFQEEEAAGVEEEGKVVENVKMSCLLPFIWTLPTFGRASHAFCNEILCSSLPSPSLIIKRLKQVDPFFINHLTVEEVSEETQRAAKSVITASQVTQVHNATNKDASNVQFEKTFHEGSVRVSTISLLN